MRTACNGLHADIKKTPAWHKNNHGDFDDMHKTFGTSSAIVISIFVTDYIHYRKAIRFLYKWQPGSSHKFTGKKTTILAPLLQLFPEQSEPGIPPPKNG